MVGTGDPAQYTSYIRNMGIMDWEWDTREEGIWHFHFPILYLPSLARLPSQRLCSVRKQNGLFFEVKQNL